MIIDATYILLSIFVSPSFISIVIGVRRFSKNKNKNAIIL